MSALLALLGGLSVVMITLSVKPRSAVAARVRRLAQGFGGLEESTEEAARTPRLRLLIERLARPLAARMSSETYQQLRRELTWAGNPYHLNPPDFRAVQALAGGVGFVVGLIVSLPYHANLPVALLMGAVASAVAAYLPKLWLQHLTEARERAIARALPNALDILSISLEAGLSVEAAMTLLVEHDSNALIDEFALYLAQLRVGTSRRDAYSLLIERNTLGDLKTVITAIRQAEELGTDMTSVIRNQTKLIRLRLRQNLEERAQQAPIKMMIPLMVFIFPVLFLFILGPLAADFLSK